VQAPAVDGKANAAVIKELALAFGLRARDFTIIHGELSRDKRLLISNASKQISEKYSSLIHGEPQLDFPK
jgi:uncharacterized protein (TIGR00251 family)